MKYSIIILPFMGIALGLAGLIPIWALIFSACLCGMIALKESVLVFRSYDDPPIRQEFSDAMSQWTRVIEKRDAELKTVQVAKTVNCDYCGGPNVNQVKCEWCGAVL